MAAPAYVPSRPAARGPRCGMALPIALGGIVLIGVLAASGLFLAGMERRAGQGTALADRALETAELGLAGIIMDWDGHRASTVPIGGSWRARREQPEATLEVEVTRLRDRTFWVVGTGLTKRKADHARRRLNAVLRLRVPPVPLAGAVTSGGPISLDGHAIVSGLAERGCVAAGLPDSAAGLVIAAADDALGDLSGVSGAPPVAVDGALGLLGPGPPLAAALAGAASLQLPKDAVPPPTRPAAGAEGCDTALATNWGEPRGIGGVVPCQAYRRIVHARGNLRLEGAHRGQGILVVEGDLSIPGRLEYRGLIVVRGRLEAAGAMDLQGAAVVGAVGDGAPSRFGAGSVVRYQPCEVWRSLTVAGRPEIARDRGWADLF